MPQPCSFPLRFGSCFYFSSRFLSLCFKRKFLWEIIHKFFLIFIISYFIEYAQCTHAFAIADRFTSPTKIQGTWVSSSTEFHILLRWKHEITFLKKWSRCVSYCKWGFLWKGCKHWNPCAFGICGRCFWAKVGSSEKVAVPCPRGK